jgi:hypothetical protein
MEAEWLGDAFAVTMIDPVDVRAAASTDEPSCIRTDSRRKAGGAASADAPVGPDGGMASRVRPSARITCSS